MATTNEWCMLVMVLMAMITFYFDFRKIRIESPRVVVQESSKVDDGSKIKFKNPLYAFNRKITDCNYLGKCRV